MRIGVDISQLAYGNTGVANYLRGFISSLIEADKKNEYILFFSSLRRNLDDFNLKGRNVSIKKFKIPPIVLDLMWNKLHIVPIENFIGNVDLFITSDWTEPPSKNKKATIIYDMIVYKYPEETDKKIIQTQKRKLNWVKKECDIIFCISESTKKDVNKILNIDEEKLKVIYPGII